MDLERILGPNGLLSEHMPGYEYRPQQIEAAVTIQQALANKKHCIVEAGTGVGKSMAYLLPAIEHAAPSRKVVVSTFTLYLQSQLINKDIPFLANLFRDRKLKVALVKGRGNYLCLSNYDAELSQLNLIGDSNLDRLQEWARKTETGDVSELGFVFPGWSEICSDQDTCHHQNCPWFSKCFYYKMRRAAQDAEIVVANHSLFFSDLEIRAADPNSTVLPEYDAVVFDEAHHLENVATKVFGVEFSNYRIVNLLNRIRRTKGLGVDPSRIQAIEELNSALFTAFAMGPKQEFFFSDAYEQVDQGAVESTVSRLCTLLGELGNELSSQETEGRQELADRIDGFKRICTRCKEDLQLLFFGADEGYFRWGERTANGKLATCFLRCSPITVASFLRDALWREVNTAILTSATLSNSGTFSYIKNRLGIPTCMELIVDSPFDFQSQCLLYIPRHLPYPSEAPEYADIVAQEIEDLVRAADGRAFLLFTSYRMMNAVYERLSGRLPYRMMKQGDMPNEALVQEFLSEENPVLFGVHSFWEGVDIRGDALSLVVIDKLPFAVPDSPINRARVDAITAAGGDWFTEYAMPQAQMRLKQGFGRLIRTKTDRGVVAILDSRLMKKSYGREFLRFLPQCPVTSDIEDVQGFYRRAIVR
ncbi:MAG: ATP-dependent DNA helicase [Armatimonadota bacterium]